MTLLKATTMTEQATPMSTVESDRSEILIALDRERQNKAERRKALYKALWDEHQVRGRWDSRLCQKYIKGEDINIQLIAAALKEMNFYSRKTNYPSYIKILKCHHRKHCNNGQSDNNELLQNQMSSYAKYAVACNLAVEDMYICNENHCIEGDLKAYHTIWMPPVH